MGLILYQGDQKAFMEDVRLNLFKNKIIQTAKQLHLPIGLSEKNSYGPNGEKIKSLLELSEAKDTFLSFEYMLPYTRQRIDCMIYGTDSKDTGYVVHIELKQWDRVSPTDLEGNFVETYTGGRTRTIEHPSQQVESYSNYLNGFIDVFSNNELSLFGCAYCYNYVKNGDTGLFDPVYSRLLSHYKTFSSSDIKELASDIKHCLCNGNGFNIFNKFSHSAIHPSKKLLDSASKIVDNNSDFSLIGDQIVAKNTILGLVKKHSGKKNVIIVSGGPGTGKTVIALHMVAELARLEKTIFFATKSKPLIEGIKNRLSRGSKAKLLFSSLDKFRPSNIDENGLDVLIIDEAHRISKSANSQYTKSEDRTEIPQVSTLIRAARTTVFFIDDKQAIRSSDVCNTQMIKDFAKEYDARIEEIELTSQFRCNGSNNYLDWIENVLGYSESPHSFSEDEYDFRIFDNPSSLYSALVQKNSLKNTSARLTAGFCWPWSKKLDSEGNLVKDVQIGDFAMPWETHGNINDIPPGYVKWYEWAYKPEGIKQVGCIYTAQGFEFDYIGVIIGNDLKYDESSDRLLGDIRYTRDPKLKGNKNFDEYVKNIYRVLLTRGMRGCYVYFCDKQVEAFFKSKLSYQEKHKHKEVKNDIPMVLHYVDHRDRYIKFLPLYSLKAACGKFGSFENVEESGWIKVDTAMKLNKGMFVVKAVGNSMEPTIHDGDYCIFKANVVGSRDGKIVLAECNQHDNDYDGSYTIKLYKSTKVFDKDTGEWKHESIMLQPINKDYDPLEINSEDEGAYQIIAEFVKTI